MSVCKDSTPVPEGMGSIQYFLFEQSWLGSKQITCPNKCTVRNISRSVIVWRQLQLSMFLILSISVVSQIQRFNTSHLITSLDIASCFKIGTRLRIGAAHRHFVRIYEHGLIQHRIIA